MEWSILARIERGCQIENASFSFGGEDQVKGGGSGEASLLFCNSCKLKLAVPHPALFGFSIFDI